MSDSASDGQKGIGDDYPRYARRAPALGVDAEGATHRYAERDGTIYVTANDEVVHDQPLDDATVGDWIAHVESDRGWTAVWWFDSFDVAIAKQLRAQERAPGTGVERR